MYDTVKGTLTSFSGGNPQRMLWLFLEDGMEDLAKAHLLNNDDWLVVFDENDDVVFRDYIQRDFRDGNIRSLGLKVNWIQKGWNADDWGRLFMTGQNPPYRAELHKKVLH
jgi:hypothetical protein